MFAGNVATVTAVYDVYELMNKSYYLLLCGVWGAGCVLMLKSLSQTTFFHASLPEYCSSLSRKLNKHNPSNVEL